ncbi:hypothetical protein B0H13DRAFT_2498336 [Mycena leptocephala]|nr:hypothetical protein B0H13DRAFT_2498336 [Mycena leptocephala]
MSSPEKAYLDMIKTGGKTSESAVTSIFDQLKPIEPSFLMSEWEGGDFDTGHPASQALKAINWAGKTFRTEEDVDPMVVYGDGGKRVVLEAYGRARVREIKFRGVVSAAMVYDDKPVIDHFRYVDQNTVAGVMDAKSRPPVYHFYLTRCRTNSESKL